LLPLFVIRKKLLADRAKLGQWGERYCERYLRRKGFGYIARNFSINAGEIDLVMTDGDVLVFVEVKTRTSEEFSKAQDAVNYPKQKKMIMTARNFINRYSLGDKAVRFDVAAIILGEKGMPEVRHYENAFSII
jgi:putative endonuclease